MRPILNSRQARASSGKMSWRLASPVSADVTSFPTCGNSIQGQCGPIGKLVLPSYLQSSHQGHLRLRQEATSNTATYGSVPHFYSGRNLEDSQRNHIGGPSKPRTSYPGKPPSSHHRTACDSSLSMSHLATQIHFQTKSSLSHPQT